MRLTRPLWIPLIWVCACNTRTVPGQADGETSTSSTTSSSTAPTSSSTDPSESDSDEVTTALPTSFLPLGDIIGDGDCDTFQQDCPEGEKCVPYASRGGGWDAEKCVYVLGDQQPGEACVYAGPIEATDDCDATSICWEGICTAMCTGSEAMPMCPLPTSCVLSGDGVLALCLADCNPLLQDCPPEHGCYWAGEDFVCVQTIPDPLAPAQPCAGLDECAVGSMCIDAVILPNCPGLGCCTPFCDIEAPGQCDAIPGTSCVSFWDGTEPVPGYENVGVCIIPP
jgi:hypothetical protein